MPATETPLRYPGGKSQVYEQVVAILRLNGMTDHVYVEPFAGGAGLALKLLLRDDVPAIVLNDIDPAIANFWRTVLKDPGYLCEQLAKTRVDMNSWVDQRKVYNDEELLWTREHAFATLFLNRTSRSGILQGGPVGGHKQVGSTKIDARLTPVTIKNLCKKIERIHEFRDRITVYSEDAVELINNLTTGSKHHFIYADPPYIKKGSALYHNSFADDDHRRFGRALMRNGCPFIVSYDEHPLAIEVYEKLRMRFLTLRYSLNSRQRTQEYLFFSNDLLIPSEFEAE
ncbi:DNA adenine methylase [Corynebacterium coyleae]|uniref:DNA adenine methylase n=1 Tax=Corynebacterium coyleae TaxID=53374 RepID=UPI00254A6892|nr:DNA adenine methylase [Corynebacterium coyleae]MDK8823440.1 DNA adenine methylase [Corynebacterium coyleae]